MSARRITTLALSFTLALSAFGLERSELLPQGPSAYVRVSNSADFWSKLKLSSVGQLWQDPRFQDFLGNPDEDWMLDLMFTAENNPAEANELLKEQMKMKTGELIVAFTMEGDSPYIISEMTADNFRRDQEIDLQIIAIKGEDSFEIVKRDFQGIEIVEHINGAGSANPSSSWQTHVGNTFVMAADKEWIERCVVRLKSDEIDAPKGDPVMEMQFPVSAIIEEVIEESETPETDRLLFEALGLTGVGNATARIELLDDRMLMDNTIAIDELDRGLFSMLDTEPSELPTVTFIPENISSIEVGRFNLLALWQEIPTILATAFPNEKPQFDMMLGMVQQQAGVNFEQDLFSHLGTKYLSYGVFEDEVAHSIIALELEDAAAFKQGLETLLSSPALAAYVSTLVDITDFLDHQIYTPKDLPPEEQFAIAVTSEHLVYGEPDAVRQMIRAVTSENAANNAFESSPMVQELRKITPPRAFGFSAVDWKKNMHAVMAELTDPSIIAMAEQELAQNEEFPFEIDFSKLPPAEHIAEFFNTTHTYVEATDAGLHQKIILKY